MIFWIVAGVMIAATAMLLFWPLARKGSPEPTRADFDLTVYRDQLAEIDADEARGLIGKAEAEAARAEIGRRMLAAKKRVEKDGRVRTGPNGTRVLAVAVAFVLSAGSLAVYGYLGSPGLRGLPLAERTPQTAEGDGANASMIAQLETRLRDQPNEIEAWTMLARLYREDGLPGKAVDAYRRAYALDSGRPEILLGLAEGLVTVNDGIVVPEARGLFARVLELEPRSPVAIYYAGLALAQDGFLDRAKHVWTQLLDSSPPDAPWVPLLRRQIAEVEAAQGSAPEARQVPEEGEASDREAFIRSMVEQLSARLESEPDDLRGWIMLARSHRVLGERDRALSALERASALAEDLPGSAPERQEIEAERKALDEIP
jgi:cytochrome c-type biogenesis protein CcmH